MNFKRLTDSTNVATAQPFGVVDVCVLVKQGCVGWNHRMYIFLIFAKVTFGAVRLYSETEKVKIQPTNGTHCCLLMAHISTSGGKMDLWRWVHVPGDIPFLQVPPTSVMR